MNKLSKEERMKCWNQLRQLDKEIAKINEQSKYDYLMIKCSWYNHSEKVDKIEKLKREYRDKDLERKRIRNILKGYIDVK